MTEREILNWEPIQEFWRNNSGVNWDELETAIKEALAGTEGEQQPEQSDDRERSDREQEPLTDEHWKELYEQLKGKVQEFFDDYLNVVEESDSGRIFNPIYVSCSRALKLEPLEKLLLDMQKMSGAKELRRTHDY